jgi:YfiH family protein
MRVTTTSSTSPVSSSSESSSARLGPAEIRFTSSADGDFAPSSGPDAVALAARRARVVDAPWTWLRQVHGAAVVVVDAPGAGCGAEADAAVALVAGAPVAVVTADCAPVVLVGDSGDAVGVVHAGWRGLVDGVIAEAVAVMRQHGSGPISAALGPCIHAECYEFAGPGLDRVVGVLGETVRATTTAGRPALDMPAAVRVALSRLDVPLSFDVDACTSCTPGYWSHRARRDSQRQATVAWLA